MTGATADDDITAEAILMAARARNRAATEMSAEHLAEITAAALAREHTDMSPGEIRGLAVAALTQAQQISFLLGKLAGLLEQEPQR